MCQTSYISGSIVRISKRSYSQRISSVNPNIYQVTQLSSLNKDLNNLYELLISQMPTITQQDYSLFGPQLEILLSTLKSLHQTCKKYPKAMGFQEETRKLEMNYSALYEVNSDIVNFRIKLPADPEIKELMNQLAQVESRQL